VHATELEVRTCWSAARRSSPPRLRPSASRADRRGSGLKVSADPQLLFRVFQNLLDNAIKYNKDGGRVEVSAEKDDFEVRVDFKTGPRHRARGPARIFDRYYQAKARREGRVLAPGWA